MTESELRQAVVSKAREYLGYSEANGKYRTIIDIYNNHTPLAAGYKMKYSDPWCATYASAVAILMNLTDIIPTECSCERQINLFKSLSGYEEDGTITPEIADYIFYNWDDSTQPNDGVADHVGIVTEVNGSSITIIEGNCDNNVMERTINVGWGFIRGYGKPNYASKCDGYVEGNTSTSTPSSDTSSSTKTYTVVKGDTLWKIAAEFLGNGARYKELMSMNGLTSTVIQIGQVIKLVAETVNEVTNESATDSTSTTENTYTVAKGDSLWKIANDKLGNGSRWPEIQKLNNISGTLIHPGDVLKLP